MKYGCMEVPAVPRKRVDKIVAIYAQYMQFGVCSYNKLLYESSSMPYKRGIRSMC